LLLVLSRSMGHFSFLVLSGGLVHSQSVLLSARTDSLKAFGALPIPGSLRGVGTLYGVDSLRLYGAIRYPGSLHFAGTFRNVGSLPPVGTLSNYDSLLSNETFGH